MPLGLLSGGGSTVWKCGPRNGGNSAQARKGQPSRAEAGFSKYFFIFTYLFLSF